VDHALGLFSSCSRSLLGEGYAVAESETCGSDDERILRVFEWAKKRGTHIHKNLSTGSFPIPGSGDPPKMVRGLMAQVSYHYSPNYYKHIPGLPEHGARSYGADLTGEMKHEDILFAVQEI